MFKTTNTNVNKNKNFRHVKYTDSNVQFVYMRLLPGEKLEREKHGKTTQIFHFTSGTGMGIINDTAYKFTKGTVFIVPPNVYHEIKNTSRTKNLNFYTIYSPPEHKPRRIDKKLN